MKFNLTKKDGYYRINILDNEISNAEEIKNIKIYTDKNDEVVAIDFNLFSAS